MPGDQELGVGSPKTWMAAYSDKLSYAFRVSSAIRHNLTKGESRELQVLDILEAILPTCVAIEKNVVIVDADSKQSHKFDGALVNRTSYPRLFGEDFTVSMIESVCTAIEVKSTLNKDEISDIFIKFGDLRSMTRRRGQAPFSLAFAYSCENLNLYFFDYAVSYFESRQGSPDILPILNKATFGSAALDSSGEYYILDRVIDGSVPVFIRTGENTLLFLVHYLSRWVTGDDDASELLRNYEQSSLGKISYFVFSEDYIKAISSSPVTREKARKVYEGTSLEDIAIVYERSCAEIGL